MLTYRTILSYYLHFILLFLFNLTLLFFIRNKWKLAKKLCLQTSHFKMQISEIHHR